MVLKYTLASCLSGVQRSETRPLLFQGAVTEGKCGNWAGQRAGFTCKCRKLQPQTLGDTQLGGRTCLHRGEIIKSCLMGTLVLISLSPIRCCSWFQYMVGYQPAASLLLFLILVIDWTLCPHPIHLSPFCVCIMRTSPNPSPNKSPEQSKAGMRMGLPWQTPLQAGEPAAGALPAPHTPISFWFLHC